MDRRVVMERVGGVLCLVPAFIHGGLTPEHFAEWWGYGLFFLAATAAQVILALALLMDAFEGATFVHIAGAIGNALLIAMYVVTRTTGIPFVGPGAGEVEPWDALGIVTILCELAATVALVWLAKSGSSPSSPSP